MTCDKYDNALLLAAASNGELDAKLARHLERCSTCRMTLRSERELLSRIDSALRAQVNEDPRPGFMAQLRLQLSKELTARPGSRCSIRWSMRDDQASKETCRSPRLKCRRVPE